MRWTSRVKPKNQEYYFNRCMGLRKCLDNYKIMPPILICAQCSYVLNRALNGKYKAVWWLFLSAIDSTIWDWKTELWFTWHYHICCKTLTEIEELKDQWLEKVTGDDYREWPNEVSVEDGEL